MDCHGALRRQQSVDGDTRRFCAGADAGIARQLWRDLEGFRIPVGQFSTGVPFVVIAHSSRHCRHFTHWLVFARRDASGFLAPTSADVGSSLGAISAVCPAGIPKSASANSARTRMDERGAGRNSVQPGAFP